MIVDPDAYLSHYGVKGMKWGVRKDRTSGAGSSRKAGEGKKKAADSDLDILKELHDEDNSSSVQKAKNIARNEEKFKQKFESNDSTKTEGSGGDNETKKGWRPTKKQVATVLVGAAFVGLVLYVHKQDVVSAQSLKEASGNPIEDGLFRKHVAYSKSKTWGSLDGTGFLQPSSFEQPEYTLPKGHEFFRLSMNSESSWSPATYATQSKEDRDRYISAFRQEKGSSADLHEIRFKATKDVKIPDLETRISAMASTLKKDGQPSDRKSAMQQYAQLCGGSWRGYTSEAFIRELKALGFDAIIDDMDAGVIGENPLVIINPDAFSPKKSSPLSAADISKAESSLIEIANRKGKAA